MTGGLPPGIRPPETPLQRFLRHNNYTPEEAYRLGRDEALREYACGVRRGGDARGGEITRGTGYITRY